MAIFVVKFEAGREKQFDVSKTTAEVNTMIKDAKVANEFVKIGDLLINPDTITEIEKLRS